MERPTPRRYTEDDPDIVDRGFNWLNKPTSIRILAGTAATLFAAGSIINHYRNVPQPTNAQYTQFDNSPADAPMVIEETRLGHNYDDFSFPDERDTILSTARRVGVDPAYLFAIREAEHGRAGFEFGIIPTDRYNNDDGITENGMHRNYTSDLEKQASWAAWSVKRGLERFNSLSDTERSSYFDFIDYIGDRYCPVGADNDPTGLNRNWETNVRSLYQKFSD